MAGFQQEMVWKCIYAPLHSLYCELICSGLLLKVQSDAFTASASLNIHANVVCKVTTFDFVTEKYYNFSIVWQ